MVRRGSDLLVDEGRLPRPGGVRDVAKQAEVSPGTVSNYLNYPDKVSRPMAVRIQRAIDELGYVANDAARTMRTGVSRTIGILLQELGAPSNSQVREGAELRAAKAGFAVIASNSAGSEQRQQGYLDLFEAQRVAGILVAPVGDIEERIRSLQKRGVVVVSLGRPADSTLCSSIAVDDFEGGRLAVSHLIETGHQRLAFVGGPLSTIERRLDGARFAVSRPGWPLRS